MVEKLCAELISPHALACHGIGLLFYGLDWFGLVWNWSLWFGLACHGIGHLFFGLDYKGLQPGMAAQPLGPDKKPTNNNYDCWIDRSQQKTNQ